MASDDGSIEWAVQSINDSGKHLNSLTIGFVGLLTYALVTAASVDHGDILVGRKVVLPLLDVKVPLHQFFAFTALFIVTLHAHIILHLMQFQDKVSSVFSVKRRSPGPNSHPEKLFYPYPVIWLRMPSLADRRKTRYKVVFSLYILMYVVAPLATLTILQAKMLPSHREFLRWFIICFFVVDAASIGLGLPVEFERPTLNVRGFLKAKRISLIALMLLISVAHIYFLRSFPMDCSDRTIFGDYGQRHLEVSPRDLADKEGPVELESRDLRCGRFSGVDLSRANFQGADLRNAVFTSAQLRGASFLPANISQRQWKDWDKDKETKRAEIERNQSGTCLAGPEDRCPDDWHKEITRLDGADFTNADLTGAILALAVLKDAQLNGADLDSADLSGVIARGAELNRAKVTFGAELFMAQLDGMKADHADFSGADLREVSAVGASMLSATLEEARLGDSDLAAATLTDAKARGANFAGSNLVGADLRGAELRAVEGLHLETVVATHADLTGASLEPTTQPPLWVDLRHAKTDPGLLEAVKNLQGLDGTFDANQNKILIDPQGPSGIQNTDEYYHYIAQGLTIERERHVGLASEGYLEKALEEIARGERVPRIRALERNLRKLGFGQEIACICTEPNDCGNSPIQGNQGDIFTGLTKKTVETQFEKLTETETDNADGTGWTCEVPTKARGEGGPKGCFCAENCGGGGIGAGPNVVHLGLTQEKIDEHYHGNDPDNPTGWLCGNYRGTVE